MSAHEPNTCDLVYGDLGGSLVFIAEDRARDLAVIHEALRSSLTWGDVRARMPAGAYQELVEISGADALPDFEEFFQDTRNSRPALTRDEARREYVALSMDERRPEPEDPFEAGDIGAICDGDWHGWTQQEMLAWVPKDVQQRYGGRGFSFVSGDCLLFRPEDEPDLIEALAGHGYRCIRDDDLVRRASGLRT